MKSSSLSNNIVVCNEKMSSLLKLGKYIQSDRELYFLSIDRLESMPVGIEQSIVHFACLIACDASSYSTEVISQFVEKLLQKHFIEPEEVEEIFENEPLYCFVENG